MNQQARKYIRNFQNRWAILKLSKKLRTTTRRRRFEKWFLSPDKSIPELAKEERVCYSVMLLHVNYSVKDVISMGCKIGLFNYGDIYKELAALGHAGKGEKK